MFFWCPYDQKYPLCTVVSEPNVTLAQPLRLLTLVKDLFELITSEQLSLNGKRKGCALQYVVSRRLAH